MTERGLPPYPTGGDWTSWARELIEYLNNSARSEEFVAPRTVFLSHQTGDVTQYRTNEDGLLMFDPGLGVPVYSASGAWKQFTASGNLAYQVTVNAGNGTVVDDINNTDFTGQTGAVGTCAQTPVATVVEFYHGGVAYLYTGPTPASYGVGCADTMQDSYLIATGVGNFLALTDTPDDYTGFGNYWPRVSPTEGELVFDQIAEADITDLDRLRWRGNWVSGNTYLKNDVALDWPYLSVANKSTTDRPAPQDKGDPFFVYAGTSPTGTITAKTLLVGNTYTMPEAGRIIGYRIYMLLGNRYTVYLKDNATGQITELLNITATGTGWQTYSTAGNTIAAGTSFDLGVRIQEPDPTPTVFTLNYDYITPNNDTIPLAGQIQHSNRTPSSFRVHKTDQNGDQSGPLSNVVVGDTIAGAGVRWSVQGVIDNTTWIDYTVAPALQGVPDGPQDFDFETAVSTPITTVLDPDYYLNNANVQPFYSIDAGQTFLTDDAYSVDIEFQQVTLSPDWDLMASSGASSSGEGGGGASTFAELSDTPTSYVGEAGKAVIVNPGENSLIFEAIQSGATYGDAFPTNPVPAEGQLHYKTGQHVGLYIYYQDASGDFFWLQTNGSTNVLGFDVFHDPTGTASWQINYATNTLECWGRVQTSASADTVVNLPKSFVDTNFVANTQWNGLAATSLVGGSCESTAVNQITISSWREGGAGAVRFAGLYDWTVKGQWDGVS